MTSTLASEHGAPLAEGGRWCAHVVGARQMISIAEGVMCNERLCKSLRLCSSLNVSEASNSAIRPGSQFGVLVSHWVY